MEVKLKVLSGTNAGQEVKVAGPKFFVGRAEDCQLRPRSDLISRHHCVIIIEDKSVAIRDFGSKNGTHVNGERVMSERELTDGDTLKIGPLEFKVSVKEVMKKRPPVTSIQEAADRTASTEFDMDVDIAAWLTANPPQADTANTGEIKSHDTQHISLMPDDTTILAGAGTPPAEADESAPTEEVPVAAGTAADNKGKKAPGRLPSTTFVHGKDSHSAAAEMLKKFKSASWRLRRMSTDDAEAIKRRYREFLDLLPMTLALAGLARAEGKRNFTPEELEHRGQVLLNAFKVARHAVREAIRSG